MEEKDNHMFKIIILLLAFFGVFSQQKVCSTDKHQEALKIKYPKLSSYEELANKKVSELVKGQKTSGQTIHIPVVFHVLYNTDEQNISDADLISQIKVLNEDFNAENIDTALVPNIFKNDVGKLNIRFHLAKASPTGMISSGIERKYTYKSFFLANGDSMKFSSSGGLDAWEPSQYLNIWVCNLLGSSGYAQYPWEDSFSYYTSGVVIDYRVVGRGGSAKAPNNLGRTLTHLVGHWLGLYHTFANGCSGLDSLTCDTEGDRVCDTPPQAKETVGCPTTLVNSCTEPLDKPDMTMNFMDLTDDACKYMFSRGQQQRAYAMIQLYRQSFLATPNNLYHNISVAIRVKPPRTCIDDSVFFYAVVSDNVSSYKWVLPGSAQGTYTIKNPIIKYSFPGYYSAELTVFDSISSYKITIDSAVNIINPPYLSSGLNEKFENSNTLPNQWEINNPDSSITWQLIEIVGPNNSGRSIYLNSYNYNVKGEKDELLLPYVKLSNTAPVLSFEHAYALYSSSHPSDSLLVMLSDNCEYSYDTLAFYYEDSLNKFATAPPINKEFFPDPKTEWCSNSTYLQKGCNTIDLQAYKGKIVRVKFVSIANYQNNLFLDNISISDTTTNIFKNKTLITNIYPNPASDFVIIKTKRNAILNVYDLAGHKLITKNLLQGENIIELQTLNRGIYFLVLLDSAKKEVYKLVVI